VTIIGELWSLDADATDKAEIEEDKIKDVEAKSTYNFSPFFILYYLLYISSDIPQIYTDVELICRLVQNNLSNGELIFELLPDRENIWHSCVHLRKVGCIYVIGFSSG
jgi:hypothetical protein